MDKDNIAYVHCILHTDTHTQKNTQWNTVQPWKKKEILPLATTWMNLDGIMFSKISQTKTNTVRYYLYVESKNKYNKLLYKKSLYNKLLL